MKNLLRIMTVLAIAVLLSANTTHAATMPWRGGFRGYASFGPPHFRGGFGYRGGFYRPYYRPYYGGYYGYGYGYPALGFRLGILPLGYYPFYFGSDLYYYYDGIYYRPYENNQYEVVAPPVGAQVNELPKKAVSIMIDGQQYYEFNSVYYKEVTGQDGKKAYVVAGKNGVLTTNNNAVNVAPQVGDTITQLPDGCHPITLNGKKYFISPIGVYYEQITDANNNAAYRVAGTEEQK